MIKKLLYRKIKSSNFKKITAGFDSAGFGNIIIPSDIDRERYIKEVYGTGYCMIVTSYNEPIKDVIVPKRIMNELIFPNNISEYGQSVVWVCDPKTNQLIIIDILLKSGEVYTHNELTYGETRSFENNRISRILDIENNILATTVSNDREENAEIITKVKSKKSNSQHKITPENYQIESEEKITLIAESNFTLKVGDEEGNKETILKVNKDGTVSFIDQYDNTIDITSNRIKINSKEIVLGDSGLEPAVLGDKYEKILEKIITAIKSITVPTAMGPSGTPNNAAQFESIKTTIAASKSKKVKIE